MKRWLIETQMNDRYGNWLSNSRRLEGEASQRPSLEHADVSVGRHRAGVYASIFLYQAAEHDYQHQARHPPDEGERPGEELQCPAPVQRLVIVAGQPRLPDRKSTRLNSSH